MPVAAGLVSAPPAIMIPDRNYNVGIPLVVGEDSSTGSPHRTNNGI